ncbi:MAG TPA: hypothetical protein VM582_02070 [Candidatus Thermoplasmatota archaeon]|nr:hypothetical protein [Candidatus Thermoplasmatota archaeon]
MRLGLLVALVLLLPSAQADEPAPPCEPEYTEVRPVAGVHLGAEVEARECPEGRWLVVGVREPTGRTSLEWHDDERGRGVAVFHPPYFVSWTDGERGCVVIVYVFALGAVESACVAGAPPPPPRLP